MPLIGQSPLMFMIAYHMYCLQDGESCLSLALRKGKLEVAKHLCGAGGKDLVLMKNEVFIFIAE